MFSTQGSLYVVATPIGNLQDFSPRAQKVLQEVQLIVAEDTRHSRQLLTYFHIDTPLQSLHEHNEKQVTPALLTRLQQGDNIALISDAGTPLVSDPGAYFIQSVHAAQLTVVPIPGASALISALSVAGFPADSFVFEGFLAAKSHARQQRLQQLAEETRTLVFYEAPHRIMACLEDMLLIFGAHRPVLLARELTKLFETIQRLPLGELLTWFQAEKQLGEFVIVVAGAPAVEKALTPEVEKIFTVLRRELPLKQAAKLTSEITGVSKNILYDWGVQSNHPVNPVNSTDDETME
jgi:16S rRNA (cytidine1402-2'-O)-methyltransferase